MHYRDSFLLFSLIMASSGYAGDKHTGKVVFPDSSANGNTTMVYPGQMPQEPMNITPIIPDKPINCGSSGWGGLIGFIVNLGGKSDKEIRMDMVTEARDRAEANAIHHTGRVIGGAQARAQFGLDNNINQSTGFPYAPETFPAQGPAFVTAPLAAQKVAAVATVIAPVAPPSLPDKTPSLPDMGQLLREAPFKLPGSNSGGSIGGGVGTGTLVAGTQLMTKLVITKTAVAAPVVTGGAATTAGATTATTWGAAIWGAAPYVAFVGGTVALTFGLIKTCDYFLGHDSLACGPAPTAEQEMLYNLQFRKDPGSVPQYIPNAPSNNTPSSPNPKKPDEPKERKFNKVQRTEALKKLKGNYKFDKQTRLYKLKDNGKPIKCSETGKEVKMVDWDALHGDIEAYAGKDKHMGSLDPETLELYKSGIKTRKTN